jgi:hypothetical protein
LAPDATEDQQLEAAEMEFRDDGWLYYWIPASDRWQIMKLTYRTEGDVLITDQPSSPREERTHLDPHLEQRAVRVLGLHAGRNDHAGAVAPGRLPVVEDHSA